MADANASSQDMEANGGDQVAASGGDEATETTADGGDQETANGGNQATTNGSDQGTANGGDQATADGGDQETADSGNQATTDGSDQGTANGGNQATADGGDQETADGGNQATTNGSDQGTANGGDQATADGGDQETADTGNQATTDGSDQGTANGGDQATADGGDQETADGADQVTADGSDEAKADVAGQAAAVGDDKATADGGNQETADGDDQGIINGADQTTSNGAEQAAADGGEQTAAERVATDNNDQPKADDKAEANTSLGEPKEIDISKAGDTADGTKKETEIYQENNAGGNETEKPPGSAKKVADDQGGIDGGNEIKTNQTSNPDSISTTDMNLDSKDAEETQKSSNPETVAQDVEEAKVDQEEQPTAGQVDPEAQINDVKSPQPPIGENIQESEDQKAQLGNSEVEDGKDKQTEDTNGTQGSDGDKSLSNASTAEQVPDDTRTQLTNGENTRLADEKSVDDKVDAGNTEVANIEQLQQGNDQNNVTNAEDENKANTSPKETEEENSKHAKTDENISSKDHSADREPLEDAVRGDDPNIQGDEESLVSEEVKKDDDISAIPDDFFYDYKELVSQPKITEESGLPVNLLQLAHSSGYDCLRRGNLCVLDTTTVAYVAGNLVQIIDIGTKHQKYLRSTGGGAVGAICLHPNRQYLAVAEKGTAPDINIYEYPSLKLHRILRGGTQQAYAYVCFSPDGKLLASVGGDPDYMLTLWNWKTEQTVLRSKAFSQDVFRVSFSTELEGQLTSSGTGHIRFWKMAHTFTGLKLQGQLGKFGKTEISDIEGYVELPDGKVLSGCENGNMLLWDGGLIKVEISRKGKRPCHHGPIQQIVMDEGELMSVGQDGWIRVWDFETIDTADSTDESGLFEMEPMNEIQIGRQENCSLRQIIKSADVEEEPTIWYAQDANGGIWKLDLSFSHTSAAPDRLLHYHAGAITGCATSPVSHLVATVGLDHTVRVHDYITNVSLCEAKFNAPGTTVIWAPRLVDTKGATMLAGFADGVVRSFVVSKKDDKHKRGEQDTELLLAEVFKPHVKAVTAMAFDHTGETLATASEDGTVFFFDVKEKNYHPIGFVTIAGPATHLSWSPSAYERNLLLVCCSNGFAQEIECPEPSTFDTSHSFHLEGLNIRTHQFQSVKSQLRREEELERKRLEQEAEKKRKDEERRMRIERGQLSESDNEEEEETKDEDKEDEDWKPYIPATPSAILYGYFSIDDPGTFWLSMDDFDAGYLYQCRFRDEAELKKIPAEEKYLPVKTIAVEGLSEIPITIMNFSDTHKQAVLGTQSGTIRIQPLSSGDLNDTTSFYELSMHDNQHGAITGLSVGYDGSYIISVGQDGNFFVYNYMSQKDVDEAVKKAKIPSAYKIPENQQLPDDIEDANAYSIEDAKQKAEHDKMMQEAEERKQDVRRIIAQLRRQFKKLLEKNNTLPEHLRLDQLEFEMDPEIKKELSRQTQEKVNMVKKELAWDSEKQQIALEKLRQRYKAILECERIIVKSFNATYEVSTYRAAKLSDDFYALKAELEQRRDSALSKARSDLSRDASLLNDDIDQDAKLHESSLGADGQEDVSAKATTNLKGSMGQRIQKALLKVEEKKKKRAARRAQWDELYNSKPDDNYEDPDDLAAIAEAHDNMGDYKLKTADDYVVPDHLRMNVEKAIMKLLVFKELIHESKYNFNQRVLSLRDRKMSLIDEINHYIQELQQVRQTLGEDKAKPIPPAPKLDPEEIPERQVEYTKESLLEFKAEMERQAILAKTGGQGGFGGFGGGGGGGGDKSKGATKKEAPKNVVEKDVPVEKEESLDAILEKKSIQPTALELKIKLAEEIRLTYQQDFLLKKIRELILNFDAELRCLYLEKLKLDVELKNADLRYITLFEEFLLLKEYEKHENTLGNKVAIKQQEKIDQQNKALEINQKIELKKKDIEKLQEKEKSLHATFMQSLGENNKFAEYLTKVFKKKIKRSKKKENADGGSDEESEEESSDEEDWSESDEESGSEGGGYDLDICPPGCDQQLYTNTCQLREKRLDIEEILAEEKKNRDQMVKDSENMTKKAKVIMAALKAAEGDLEAFQLEKQQKLNEFEIVVTVHLHQLLHHENGRLPNDLQQCLVFNSNGLVRLSHRIKELEHEKAVQKRQQKDAKKKHVQLLKDRKFFEAKIGEMDGKCNEEMKLKFGRIVDLEELEQVTVNRQVEELKEKLRITEIECSEDLKRWEEKIRRKKDKITELIKENTNRIETLNMMQSEKRDLQMELNSKQKNLGGEFSGVRKADIHERERLVQLVQLQAQEVDALKEEIVMLSHKGGHILPPTQPPASGDGSGLH